MKRLNLAGCLILLVAVAPLGYGSDDATLDMLLDLASRPQGDGPGLFESAGQLIGQRAVILSKPDMLRAELSACGKCARRAEIEKQLREADFAKSVLELAESAYFGNTSSPFPSVRERHPYTAWKAGIKIRPDYINAQLPPGCVKLYDMAMDCAVEKGHDNIDSPQCSPYLKLSGFCSRGETKKFTDYLRTMTRMHSGELMYETKGSDMWPEFVYHNVPAGTALPIRGGPTEGRKNFWIVVVNDVRGAQIGELENLSVNNGMGRSGLAGMMYSQTNDFESPWKEQYSALLEELISDPATLIIKCQYTYDPVGRTVSEYYFWYEQVPPMLANAAFTKEMPLNPLARIGPAISQCPPTQALARKRLKLIPWSELRRMYEGKLSGSPEPVTKPTLLLQ